MIVPLLSVIPDVSVKVEPLSSWIVPPVTVSKPVIVRLLATSSVPAASVNTFAVFVPPPDTFSVPPLTNASAGPAAKVPVTLSVPPVASIVPPVAVTAAASVPAPVIVPLLSVIPDVSVKVEPLSSWIVPPVTVSEPVIVRLLATSSVPAAS